MMRFRRRGRFTRKVETSVERDGTTYWVEVTLDCVPGSPGRTYGDPDDCYPPEPDTAEPVDILVLDTDDSDKSLVGQHVDWEIDLDELDELTRRAFEEQADADEAAYWEAKLDAMREGDFGELSFLYPRRQR